jgi:hypothetical protein
MPDETAKCDQNFKRGCAVLMIKKNALSVARMDIKNILPQ